MPNGLPWVCRLQPSDCQLAKTFLTPSGVWVFRPAKARSECIPAPSPFVLRALTLGSDSLFGLLTFIPLPVLGLHFRSLLGGHFEGAWAKDGIAPAAVGDNVNHHAPLSFRHLKLPFWHA